MANLPAYREGAGNLQSCLNNYTVSNLLAANVPEFITVPIDDSGLKAKYVTFGKGAAADFYAKAFATGQGEDRVTNGTFAEYVTNGTFASDTGWTKGTGWTIAAGVATATGAISTALSQTAAIALIPGYSYTVTFTTSSVSAGSVAVSLGGGTAGTSRSTDATFKETIIAGSDGTIKFTGSGFTGNIDNVTISGWILTTGWTTDGSTAIATGAISTDLSQTANVAYPLVAGQVYYVTYTATAAAGAFTVSLGGGTAGASRSTSATFSEYLVAGTTQTILFDAASFTGTIDNVSVIPAAQVGLDSTSGQSSEQNPPGYFLNGNIATISIVSAGTPIITANFYK